MLRHDGAGPVTSMESSGIEKGASVWESNPGGDPFYFVHLPTRALALNDSGMFPVTHYRVVLADAVRLELTHLLS